MILILDKTTTEGIRLASVRRTYASNSFGRLWCSKSVLLAVLNNSAICGKDRLRVLLDLNSGTGRLAGRTAYWSIKCPRKISGISSYTSEG